MRKDPKRGDLIEYDGIVWTVLHVGVVDGAARMLLSYVCNRGHTHVWSGVRGSTVS